MNLRSGCLALALALSPIMAPALAQAKTPVTPTKWGGLSIQLTRAAMTDDSMPAARLTLRNGTRTIFTISDFAVEAKLIPLRPGGMPELVVSTFSGGAHCCSTSYIFTQDTGSVQNIGIINESNYGFSPVDLNKDGTFELVFVLDTLAYFDYSYADSPGLSSVIGWDGIRLADRTRAYAYVPSQEAARELKELRSRMIDYPDLESLTPRLSGYYGNMILAGRGAEAEKVIAALPGVAPLKAWFAANRTGLISALYGEPERRVQAVNSTVYPIPVPEGEEF
ncbi:hypothetical protein E7T06_12040 [Deinococcus sp. Arct2-2]|uniref:hypothetical protein n=1 Tax=Deinococcus sp. Arct2-2 TaxID=2568653 RepID=UPI0010A2D356|nr:hypothetical protein [Deinococcus sp. Arct2-2]THF69414.1 hypothetical protein E7T06_12040 [Deinococcus sp. Arct2-2]